jgi:hypothetical protein
MLRRIPKVLLLVALLAAFVASSAVAFGSSRTCGCFILDKRILRPAGGCHFDQHTLQCVNVNCRGIVPNRISSHERPMVHRALDSNNV